MPHDINLRYDQWDYNSDCERVGLSRPTRYDRAPPGQRPFPSPFQLILDGDTRGTVSDELEAPYSQHELQMIRLSYAIRQKAGWETKRLDADVRTSPRPRTPLAFPPSLQKDAVSSEQRG